MIRVLLLALFAVPVLRADPSVEQLVLATYKLGNEASTATCLAVQYQKPGTQGESIFLVTADHVLTAMKGDFCQLIARSAAADGSYHRQEIQIAIRRKGTALWRKHPTHDLAVLPLPLSVQIEALPLEVLAEDPAMTVGDGIRMATFPERFEVNDAGFPVVRSGSICSFPLKPVESNPTFLIDVTSFSGDSGAPVMLSGTTVTGSLPEVVGIVLGQHRITETVKETKFEERKIHYPLGLSFAIHASYARKMIEH